MKRKCLPAILRYFYWLYTYFSPFYENTVKFVFQAPVFVLIGAVNVLEMPYIGIELASHMCCTRRVIIYHYFINAGFISDLFYGNTVKLVYQPPVLVLIGALNDQETPYIGIALVSVHVVYTSRHYLSLFHQSRIYLGLFL